MMMKIEYFENLAIHAIHKYLTKRANTRISQEQCIKNDRNRFLLLRFSSTTYTRQQLVHLTSVEIPSSVFDNRSDTYEEYVDLDTLRSGTPDWAYRVVKQGKPVINRTDLAGFLDIFGATLGFLQLTINGVKRYFVYLANGLEPRDIK
jgi:hypothetical protein